MFLTTLLEPFQFDFMVNALMVSVIVAIPCALLSVFLVLKGWALMGDAMSHAVFPGVVLAYIVGDPPGDWRFHCRIILRYRDRLSGR
ncbi:iron transport inner membrane protein [Salmonella enterica subsp. enterica]|uniref:Iron transport inner membrane protein n=1 Tax=Salmonella enterica I TaxID=59201 RepID=A0A379WNY4_SALET|nr:iron transport inner membrane protein [Salmonella enterica subsp. enterica]